MPEPPDNDKWNRQREDCATGLATLLADAPARVFFSDDAGSEGTPCTRHKWVTRGSRLPQGYFGSFLRRNVVGAVEPVRRKPPHKTKPARESSYLCMSHVRSREQRCSKLVS